MPFDVWNVVDADAMRVMREHVMSEPHTEVGGFLLGEHGARHEPPHIAAAVPALDAEGDLTHLTFTHGAWEHVHRTIDADFPDSSIIGWYHSHPGHGIFLSAHDKFIQRNFFSAAWQVAVVIDPVARTEGFFAWAHDDIVLVSERDVGGRAFAPATPAARAAFRGRRDDQRGPRRKLVVSLDDIPETEHRASPRPPVPDAVEPTATNRTGPEAASTPSDPERSTRQPVRPEPGESEPYPLAGHLIPVGAGLVLGAILALVV